MQIRVRIRYRLDDVEEEGSNENAVEIPAGVASSPLSLAPR
jgi:hypothetical protein